MKRAILAVALLVSGAVQATVLDEVTVNDGDVKIVVTDEECKPEAMLVLHMLGGDLSDAKRATVSVKGEEKPREACYFRIDEETIGVADEMGSGGAVRSLDNKKGI